MADAAAPNVEALLAHARWARSLARELVGGDVHQAEDLAQEAMAAALTRPPQDEQRAQGWLARVLRNRRVSNLRRDQTRARAEPRAARAEAQPSTLELVEQAETQRRLVACVLALEEPYRRVVLLRWFGDLPPREIAQRENIPLATVTSRLTRAHAKLRERLEREFGDQGRSWIRALAPLALADLRAPVAFDSATSSTASSASSSSAVSIGAVVVAVGAGLGVAALLWVAWRARAGEDRAHDAAQTTASASGVQLAAASSNETSNDAQASERLAQGASPAPLAAAPTPRVRGRVVFSDGRPAAGARIGAGPLEWFELRPPPASFRETTSDAEGRFEFEQALDAARDTALNAALNGARTRSLSLLATHPDAAPSAPERLDGATLAREGAEVVLTLRAGARVEGVVFGPDGKPAARRAVRLASDFGAPAREATSDQGGAFAFERLAPGRWTILSFPGDEELREHRLGEPGSVSAFEHLAQRTLALRDGVTEHVELGQAPERPVRVEGRVTAGGAAQSALLQFVGAGERALELQRIARTDSDGRYRVALAEPGSYLVKITVFDAPGTHAVERIFEAPAEPSAERNFELPSGAIRGRVIDERGEPVAGASVRLKLERGGSRSLLTSFSDAKPTGADGSFAFERLDDGGWSLAVNCDERSKTESNKVDSSRAEASGADSKQTQNTAEQGVFARTAASVSAVLDVRDGLSVDDVVIQIASGALLRGFLNDEEGAPAPLASIFVHAADGRQLTPFAWSASDLEGAFRGPALAPGDWWVHARGGGLCSTPVRVRVGSEALPALELELTPGGYLEVRFESAEHAAHSSLSLVDDSSREFAGLVDRALKSLDILTAFTPGSARLGPLPQGSYRLTVTTRARPSRTLTLGLEAGATTTIDLR